MTIRAASANDAEGIASVLVAAWRFAYTSFMPTEFLEKWCDVDQRADRIRSGWRNDCLSLVAINEDGVRGVATERPCEREGIDSEIVALYVHPVVSRSGVGRALVRQMTEIFIGRGAESMAIHTLAENAIGRAFYEKIGGVVEIEAEWNGFESVVYVWRDLPSLVRAL